MQEQDQTEQEEKELELLDLTPPLKDEEDEVKTIKKRKTKSQKAKEEDEQKEQERQQQSLSLIGIYNGFFTAFLNPDYEVTDGELIAQSQALDQVLRKYDATPPPEITLLIALSCPVLRALSKPKTKDKLISLYLRIKDWFK